MGLGLSISMGPADGDLLSEPTCSRREGSTPPKFIKHLIKLGKSSIHKTSVKTRGSGGGGGGGGLVTSVEIEFQ